MSYYDADPWANHELNEVKCAECSEYFDDQEGEGNICPPCIEKGEQVETYLITFEITTETDPNEWDWQALLDLNPAESYKIHSIGQITRNKREGK